MARRSRVSEIGVLMLAHQLISSPHTPPVTLAAILIQAAIYLGFIPLLDESQIHNLCVLPARIWYNKEWIRLIFSGFMHADDMHLYFNMISFLWKGRRLERKFGSAYFAFLLLTFSLLTNIVLVAISVVLDNQFMNQCAVGFSGVLFALKVLMNHYFPHDDVWLFGWLPVQPRYACWLELVVIQLLVPSASFVGHLAGILVGLAYTAGPLKSIMNFTFDALIGMERFSSSTTGSTYGRNQSDPIRTDGGRPGADFNTYTGGLSEEEQMRRAMDESRRNYRAARPSAPPYEGFSNYNRIYPDFR